jgi:pimeloyl-ACP methyl ester carboxylesterase
MRAFLGLQLVLAVSAVGCSSASESAAPAPISGNVGPPQTEPAAGPKLETTACRFVVPRSVEGKTFYCADLSVPENRRSPGKEIKIHVAVIKGKPGGVPIIELVGGPGGSADGMVGGVAAGLPDLMKVYGKFLEQGDVVFFDQRGVGRSMPRLACDLENGRGKDPISACRQKLEAEGIDVAAYDTIENADDVHDLKLALGVPKVDLHGISYGTRLGIEILKRHADDVRSAIIDGVMPSDVPVLGYFEVSMNNVLSRVFDACVADTNCNKTYPNLETSLTNLKKKLETKPFEGNDPMHGKYPYDWFAFVDELIQRSYEEGTAARIPHWIHSLLKQNQAQWKAGQDKAAAEMEKKFQADEDAAKSNPLVAELFDAQAKAGEEDIAAADMAYGMYLSVTCNDYAQHESIDAARKAQSTVRAALRNDELLAQEFDDCAKWATRPSDPTVRLTPSFAGPVLVIGGSLDPATPSQWAKHVSESLPQDQFVEVPTGGHGLMDACGAELKGGFFADPGRALDTTCATQRSIQFYYEGSTQHSARRAVFQAIRPFTTTRERISNRVLAASTPFPSQNLARRVAAVAR